MNRFLKAWAFSVLFSGLAAISLQAAITKINQQTGAWQNQKDRQIQFSDYKKIVFSFDNVPLKKVAKIALHKNNIFILDSKRSELYVIDKNGKYLYTVGRPGQGPGEIEHGCDFLISRDERIYVLSSFSRRIEVFDIKGKRISTIRLRPPVDWMSAKSMLEKPGGHLIVGSSYQDIIAIYNKTGEYLKTILESGDLEAISKSTLGINAQLSFLGDDILLFDAFRGMFVKLSLPGNIEAVFSGFSHKVSPGTADIEKQFRSPGSQAGNSRHLNITSWTDFCVDEDNNIYVIPLKSENDGYQNLFVFSQSGDLLYKMPLTFFKGEQIRHICRDSNHFLFMTKNFDLIKAKIRRKK